MKISVKLAFCALLMMSASFLIHANAEEHDANFKVILKLDDMVQKGGEVPQQWQRVHAYGVEQSLPLSMGIICNSLDGVYPNYFQTLKEWNASGLVEFWNHGYDHRQWQADGQRVREFNASGYEHQSEHFQRSQQLAVDKLDLDFTTFGAPFNSTDAETDRVLQETPEITAWLYGPRGTAAGKTVLKRNFSLNLEVKVGDVDFEAFKAAYNAKPVGQLLVLQGHPMGWDDDDFLAFTQIVDFLSEQGAVFVLPRDCVAD
jgi:peptidoglycan/xylan/chitin deacetylase (PgdA/CDA1 family)